MENMVGEFQQSFAGKTSLFLIFIHLLVIIMCIVIKQKSWIWINGIPSGHFQFPQHLNLQFFQSFLIETKKSILQKREDKEIEDGAIWGDSHVFQVWIDGVQVYSGRFNHCIGHTVKALQYRLYCIALTTSLFIEPTVISNQPSDKPWAKNFWRCQGLHSE